MVKIIWMPQAITDLENIASYIGKDSPEYAEVLIKKIFLSVEKLSHFPKIS